MKKNRQYYKSKKRVLKYRKIDTDKVISAIRIATEVMMSAIQINIVMSEPKFKTFESGGKFTIIGESEREMVLSNNGKSIVIPDKHGDVLIPNACKIPVDAKLYNLLNHETEVDKQWDRLLKAMNKTTSIDDRDIAKHL